MKEAPKRQKSCSLSTALGDRTRLHQLAQMYKCTLTKAIKGVLEPDASYSICYHGQ